MSQTTPLSESASGAVSRMTAGNTPLPGKVDNLSLDFLGRTPSESLGSRDNDDITKDSRVSDEVPGEDVTDLAKSKFVLIDRNEFVGVSPDEVECEESFPCNCHYNPDTDARSAACGESSDCINRLIQMECNPLTCPTGSYCLNRRFQKKQYAAIRVVDTGLKGYGVQAAEDLESGRFIMEYMGEVVTSVQFLKRTRQYEQDGIRHHYCMSIGYNLIIDATKKGCLSRYINHSCDPNCVLQKWMVGGQIRMGIFAKNSIKRGEELTFDYKFERLPGTEPQKCLCGSANCKGVIGVTKETARPTDSEGDDEDAEIEDEMEGGDVTTRQKVKLRRRSMEDNEDEYVDPEYERGRPASRSRKQRGLFSEEQVLKFVQIMMRSSRNPKIMKLLMRKLMETEDRRLLKSFVTMRGLSILSTWLGEHKDDDVMVIEILQCINALPIRTKNTVEESQAEAPVRAFAGSDDEIIASLASEIVGRWDSLKRVYKIPKKRRAEAPDADASDKAQSSTESSKSNARVDVGGDRRSGENTPRSPAHSSRLFEPQSSSAERHPPVSSRSRQQQHTGPASFRDDRRPPFGHSSSYRTDKSGTGGGHRRYRDWSEPRSSWHPGTPGPGEDPSWTSSQQRQLPPGWHTTTTETGDVYYYHEETKHTQWEPPASAMHSQGGSSGSPDTGGAEDVSASTALSASFLHSSSRDSDSVPFFSVRFQNEGASTDRHSWNDSHLGASAPNSSGHPTPPPPPPPPLPLPLPQAQQSLTGGTSSSIITKARIDEVIRRAMEASEERQKQLLAQQHRTKASTAQRPTDLSKSESDLHKRKRAKKDERKRTHTNGHQHAERRKENDDSNGSAKKDSSLEKRARIKVADLVVKLLSQHKSTLFTHESFKHEARKITKIVMEKEHKSPNYDPQRLIDMGSSKQTKIHEFVKTYVQRLLERSTAATTATGSEAADSNPAR